MSSQNQYFVSIIAIVLIVGIVLFTTNNSFFELGESFAGQAVKKSTTCADTDSGLDYTTVGTISGGKLYSTGKAYVKKTDSCANLNQVNEGYCVDSTTAKIESVLCEDVVGPGSDCKGGVCSAARTCDDTDPDNTNDVGIVTVTEDGTASETPDACQDTNTVLEYSCNDRNRAVSEERECDEGQECDGGLCVDSPSKAASLATTVITITDLTSEKECVDSDGYDPYTAGSAYYPSDVKSKVNDWCTWDGYYIFDDQLIEYICSNGVITPKDYYCVCESGSNQDENAHCSTNAYTNPDEFYNEYFGYDSSKVSADSDYLLFDLSDFHGEGISFEDIKKDDRYDSYGYDVYLDVASKAGYNYVLSSLTEESVHIHGTDKLEINHGYFKPWYWVYTKSNPKDGADSIRFLYGDPMPGPRIGFDYITPTTSWIVIRAIITPTKIGDITNNWAAALISDTIYFTDWLQDEDYGGIIIERQTTTCDEPLYELKINENGHYTFIISVDGVSKTVILKDYTAEMGTTDYVEAIFTGEAMILTTYEDNSFTLNNIKKQKKEKHVGNLETDEDLLSLWIGSHADEYVNDDGNPSYMDCPDDSFYGNIDMIKIWGQ